MAQQCFMFLDWGDGWVAVNDHDNDVAALDGFSIQWGTDGIDQQPDPSVMTFRLRDSTGWLTGRALTLAGARVLVQISARTHMGHAPRRHGRMVGAAHAFGRDAPGIHARQPVRQVSARRRCSMDWCRTAAKPGPAATAGYWNSAPPAA